MAGKTNTELIRDLTVNVNYLEKEQQTLQRDHQDLKGEHKKTVELQNNTVTRMSVQEARFEDFKKTFEDFKKIQEENARQRWLLWVAAWGSLLTLLANLAISFLRR